MAAATKASPLLPFTPADWSQLLTLVELLLDAPVNVHASSSSDKKASTPPTAPSVADSKNDELRDDKEALWDLSRANVYELGFWRDAEATVTAKCARINIALHYRDKADGKAGERVLYASRRDNTATTIGMAYYQSGSTASGASTSVAVPLRRRDIAQLRRDIQHYFTGEGTDGVATPIFDYCAVLTRILRACSHVLAHHLPHLPTLKTELDKISVVNTIASGEEWMVPYEISFEANMAEYRVALPDPFKLTPAHTEELLKLFKLTDKGKLYHDMWMNLFDTGCHEILHCVQAVAGQRDSRPLSWSAEHDASYAAQSLLAQIAMHGSATDLFPPGFVYQVLNNNLRWARRCYALWTDDVKAEYFAWRDSFGLVSPSKKIGEQTTIVDEFKGILTTESTYLDAGILHSQLDVLFNARRTGDVHAAAAIVLPPSLQRIAGRPRAGLLVD